MCVLCDGVLGLIVWLFMLDFVLRVCRVLDLCCLILGLWFYLRLFCLFSFLCFGVLGAGCLVGCSWFNSLLIDCICGLHDCGLVCY